MINPNLELNLTIPEQSQISLSFADHTPAAIKQWVNELPLANVGEISRQLYQAIIEFNKLTIAPVTRTQILELLRPPIDYVCKELSKHFLNQSVVLNEKQQKIANLAQAIQLHLATGYKVVLVETLAQVSNDKVKKNFTCATHRMMSEYGQVMLRAHQLYTAVPKNVWLEMHQVYQLAETLDLLKYTVADDQRSDGQETRIDQIYKQNLLLGCCRSNQLRQNEIQTAFDAFGLWTGFVKVGADLIDESVFLTNIEQDLPPRYKSLLKTTSTSHYGFDTTELVSRLDTYLEHIGTKTSKDEPVDAELPLPKFTSDVVINHLRHAFGVLTKRSFKRIANDGSLNLCVGLSASHYYTSGQVEFHTQMLHQSATSIESDNNIFLTQAQKQQDVWGDSYDTGSHSATTPSDAPINFGGGQGHTADVAYPQYTVPLVNTSPGGYCLQWDGEVPSNIQAGEVMTLRETDKQGWSIAVIRWIRHIKQQGTQIGIELLAPSAQPCGVQLLQKTGDPSEYLRGLLLPELSAIGQPATLITPRLPFQSGHKVSIRLSGVEGKCQLENRLSATGSFSQFELSESTSIKDLAAEAEKPEINISEEDDDFDSLWPSL